MEDIIKDSKHEKNYSKPLWTNDDFANMKDTTNLKDLMTIDYEDYGD